MRAGGGEMRRGGGQMHFKGENTISSQLSRKRLFISTEMVRNRGGDYTDSCQSEQSCAVYKETNLHNRMQYSIVFYRVFYQDKNKN
jgi:hypothetical protein